MSETPAHTSATGAAREFGGSVHVRFLDTMLASTDRAWVLADENVGPLYLIPFDDVYFEFLERTDEALTHPARGKLGVWRVSAAGRAEDAVMWTLDEPPEDFARFGRYAIFDSSKVAVESLPDDRGV